MALGKGCIYFMPSTASITRSRQGRSPRLGYDVPKYPHKTLCSKVCSTVVLKSLRLQLGCIPTLGWPSCRRSPAHQSQSYQVMQFWAVPDLRLSPDVDSNGVDDQNWRCSSLTRLSHVWLSSRETSMNMNVRHSFIGIGIEPGMVSGVAFGRERFLLQRSGHRQESMVWCGFRQPYIGSRWFGWLK